MKLILPAFGAVIPGQGGRLAAITRGPVRDGVELEHQALIITDRVLEIPSIEWGEYDKKIEGANSRTDGQANFTAMLAAECPVALRIAELRADEHADLFLPALGQLNAAAANVPEQFDPDGVYWTSTQGSALYAFVQNFAYGGSHWDVKDNKFRARAFRMIPLQLLTA